MVEIVEVVGVLRDFINEELLERLGLSTDPLAEGLLDSLALEQLIDLTEEHYGILFEQEEIERPRFASLPTFAAVVVNNIATSPYHPGVGEGQTR